MLCLASCLSVMWDDRRGLRFLLLYGILSVDKCIYVQTFTVCRMSLNSMYFELLVTWLHGLLR